MMAKIDFTSMCFLRCYRASGLRMLPCSRVESCRAGNDWHRPGP